MKNIALILFLLSSIANAQGTWTQKANFGGGVRAGATALTIGNKAYIGHGGNMTGTCQDFWEYDPATDIWTQKANHPYTSGNAAGAGFGLGTKGYMGLGQVYGLWEYDPANNTWAPAMTFQGSGTAGKATFVIGTKGYAVAGGEDSLWEFDQATGVWTQKSTSITGTVRDYAVGFAIGTKGYMATGGDYTAPIAYNELWEYNSSNNTWSQKANCPSTVFKAAGFAIGTKGYVCTGYNVTTGITAACYEYNSVANTWSPIPNLPGGARYAAVGFSIGNYGYIATGNPDNGTLKNDLWMYTPAGAGVNEGASKTKIKIYPNPVHDIATISVESTMRPPYSLQVIDINGAVVKTIANINSARFEFQRGGLASGIYFMNLLATNDQMLCSEKIVVK